MKKILNILIVSILLVACSTVETADLGIKSKWIQVGSESFSGKESDGTIMVPIQLASDSNPEDLTVSFTVTSSDSEKFTIVPSGGTIVIPKGEFEAFIEITPIDNLDVNENININIDLNENEKYGLGLLGEGLESNKTVVTILDDDCPLDVTEFYGQYDALEDGQYEYVVTVSAGPVPGTLTLDNLYETGGTTVIELNNTDPSNPFITFRSREFSAVLQDDPTYGDLWATDPTAINSSFRTCDKFMDLVFRRCVSVGCYGGTVNVKLTKQ